MNRTNSRFLAVLLTMLGAAATPVFAAGDAFTGKESEQELWEALLRRGGIEDTKVRRDFYREMESARKGSRETYPASPLADLKKIENPLSFLGGYPSLKGTAFLLFNCGGERFAKRLRDAGADAASCDIPSGHSIPHERTKPRMFDFFDEHVNDCAPDLRLAKRLLLQKAP